MAAYAFARLRFRFGGAVLAVLVGTMVVPIFVIVIATVPGDGELRT